jgi:hypothetical protein
MKKLLLLAVLSVVALAAVGFQRGWFQFASEGAGDKTNLTLTVDKNKIHEDEAKAKGTVHDAKEKVADAVEKHVK